MRIRGKRPWALIGGKIVRFKTQEDFDHWSDADLRRRLEETDKLRPDQFLTIEEVRENLKRRRIQRATYWNVTRRPKKKRIRRRRLWPA